MSRSFTISNGSGTLGGYNEGGYNEGGYDSGVPLDYFRYLYDAPQKDDRLGDSILMDFTLAPIDSSFVRPSRGNYVTVVTDTFGTWYTGYIINEPEYTYLGTNGGQPAWGYHYQASSDEIILSQNALGIVPPFLNQTQGEILIALAELAQPGLFDYSNVEPGQTLAMYVVNPTQKFADVAQAFCNSAVYRCFGKNKQLFFVPQNGLTVGLTVDGNNRYFTPGDLTVAANTNMAICNDCLVTGNIEPCRYTAEYFVGDGFTGEFNLSASVFGTDSAVLLADTFTGSTFNNTNWNVYDEPVNYIQLFNGYVNVVGGTGDGMYEVHLDSANLIPLSGALRLAHGEYDFVPQTTNNIVCGVICGLWTQEPNAALTGCVYGLQVNKNAGVVSFSPIYNGVVDTAQVQVVQTSGQTANVPLWNDTTSYTEGQIVSYLGVVYICLATTAPGDEPLDTGYWAANVAARYVLRTIITTQEIYRMRAQYNYRLPTGGVGYYGGGSVPDTLTITTYVTSLDPNTGLITGGYPVTFVGSMSASNEQLYAYYIPVASNDLHVTFTDVTISTPMQASLEIISDGPGDFISRLVGPNEIDATDGLAPWATIADSGSGVTQQQSILGSPQYAFGNPQLQFFKDTSALTTTIPQQGDLINLTYRSAGASMGRCRDQNSVNLEAENWGDSGIRSQVQMSGVTPQPQTSADCESAAAATIGQASYTHYQGTYSTIAQNCQGEPVSGSNLQFLNLPLYAFPISNFNEPITEVITHFNATSQGEQFDHKITFGLNGDSQRLLTTLAGFALQANVFTPTATAQTPIWVPPSTLAMAYATEVTNPGLDYSNNGAYGTWQANTIYTPGTIIVDANGNKQIVVGAGGRSGAFLPAFASLINSAGQAGVASSIGQIQITAGVLTVACISDLTGIVNILAKVNLAGLTACTELNGLTVVSTSVTGLAFTANVNLPDYDLAGDTGTATVVAVGPFKPITTDGAVQWQLLGHSYGVDGNNFYYNTGQAPNVLGLLPTGGGYGTDPYGTDPYGESLSAIPGTGFEVRYTDDSWGCDPGKNLAGRFTTQLFSLPRNQRNSVVFMRAYDARNLIRSSENWVNYPTLAYSCWTGSAVSQVYGPDPDGDTSLLNKLTLLPGSPLTQTTQAYTYTVGTSVVFTVSVNGPVGGIVTLSISCATSGNGNATQSFVMCGVWQRFSVSMVTTGAATEGYVCTISSTSTLPLTATWASCEQNTAVETIYCKTQDTQLTGASTPYGATSRYGASVRVGYPLIPPAPTGFIDPTDPANPIVNLILPPVSQDVWGIEIRAADNATVLYAANLTDSGYAPAYTYVNNTSRSLTFNLYTYNLLGEYSPGFNLTFTIPLPSVMDLVVEDALKSLVWSGSLAVISYNLEIDATSDAFADIISTNTIAAPATPYLNNTTQLLSDPDFFYQRWFRVTPYDDLGSGPAVILSHIYTPAGVVQFNANEAVYVAAPSTPITDPIPPPVVYANPARYIEQSWSDYVNNQGRQ
jgi:hypothetical protein